MSAKKSGKGNGPPIVASFRHWRTGELIEAKKFGLKGFPMRNKKRRPK